MAAGKRVGLDLCAIGYRWDGLLSVSGPTIFATDIFGVTDPRLMLLHLFWNSIRLDYSSGKVRSCVIQRATGVFGTLAIVARGQNLALRGGATGNGAALHRRPLHVAAD